MMLITRITAVLRQTTLKTALDSNTIWPLRLILLHIGLWLDSGQWLGSLWRRPHPASVFAQAIGSHHQINHLGNVYAVPPKALTTTQTIEKNVLEYVKHLLAAPNSIEGYCTSGGTEANLFLLWAARNYLQKRSGQAPVVLTTNLTHYSVAKATNILSLDHILVASNPNDYTLSVPALSITLEKLARAKQTSVAICLTLGYSSTGSCDDISKILTLLQHWQTKYAGHVFAWIDAAGQGLPLATLEAQFLPFSNSIVYGYVLDFHKLGTSPLPSGIVLYRNILRRYIEQPIPYLPETDATLLGSRPGSSALAIWALFISSNIRQQAQHYHKLLCNKDAYIAQLQQRFPGIKIITHPHTLSAGIVVNRSFPRLTQNTENKFGLRLHKIPIRTYSHTTHTYRRTLLKHYTIHFLYDPMPPIW